MVQMSINWGILTASQRKTIIDSMPKIVKEAERIRAKAYRKADMKTSMILNKPSVYCKLMACIEVSKGMTEITLFRFRESNGYDEESIGWIDL